MTDTTDPTDDEHHTMDELYEYRMLYNAHAGHGWLAAGIPVVKSWRHSDGELCFGGGWFIVAATLPTGQVSNHYAAEHWDLFALPEVELPPEYDGHTPALAAERLRDALPALVQMLRAQLAAARRTEAETKAEALVDASKVWAEQHDYGNYWRPGEIEEWLIARAAALLAQPETPTMVVGCPCGHTCEHGPHEFDLDHDPETLVQHRGGLMMTDE